MDSYIERKPGKIFLIILTAFCNCLTACEGQQIYGENFLTLSKVIAMPEVKGRIDHMDVNLKNQLIYIAALGNNTLEVADLKTGKIIKSIKGLDEPQGIGYIPQTDEILVANGGNGDCYFYDAVSYQKKATLHLASDADDVRYDSVERKLYVGYGSGGIAIIDPDTHLQTTDIKLPAHPEGFTIDSKNKLLYVNVPNNNMIGVIDLKQGKLIDKWISNNYRANFPISYDAMNRQLFVGYRHPATLLLLNSATGKEITSASMVEDIDDLYFDSKTSEVFISGGGGFINIFQYENQKVKQIVNIPTRKGARTSLLIPELRLYVLAARAAAGKKAELHIYHLP
jgi:DNA-binding beta-propeller fold protein YncE